MREVCGRADERDGRREEERERKRKRKWGQRQSSLPSASSKTRIGVQPIHQLEESQGRPGRCTATDQSRAVRKSSDSHRCSCQVQSSQTRLDYPQLAKLAPDVASDASDGAIETHASRSKIRPARRGYVDGHQRETEASGGLGVRCIIAAR